MINHNPPNHAWQFEKAIATAIACRTIIRYNSTLDDEQKNEILAELDATLQFLRDRLIANAAVESNTIIPPLQLAEILAASAANEEEEVEDETQVIDASYISPQEMQELSEPLLRNLYNLYHAYLNTRPGKGINALEMRYKKAMSVLEDVQAVLRLQRDTSTGEDGENLIYQVQGFIAALYSMFHEFAAVLAKLLEGKDIMADTDQLTSLQKFAAEQIHQRQYLMRDITPLMGVYSAHLQLQQRKGQLAYLANDATAFLIFLEERLGSGLSKRQEIVEQLRSVAELLHDLSALLSDYEQAFSATLSH